jgi:hypothetical protein
MAAAGRVVHPAQCASPGGRPANRGCGCRYGVGVADRPVARPRPYRGPGWSATPVLGVDVGGVIVTLAEDGADTSFFGNRPLETPAVDGVFDALTVLAREPFEGRIHIVSKAGPKVALTTRDWLVHHRFYERTGIPAGQVHFVRERRDKAPVCERLGVTHFVDDRLDVLVHLTTVPHRYLFVGGRAEPEPRAVLPGWVTMAETWSGLLAELAGPGRDDGFATR